MRLAKIAELLNMPPPDGDHMIENMLAKIENRLFQVRSLSRLITQILGDKN